MSEKQEIYKINISLLGKIEYEGIITKKDNNIYIKTQIDKDEYEKIIKEMLLEKGNIKVTKSPNHQYDFCIKREKFNSLKEFFIKLQEDGFDVKYEQMENNYKYQPKNKEELVEAIKKEIFEIQGTKDNPNWNADLNCIDTSLIKDMSNLFSLDTYGLEKFNGDISQWNTKNVKNMAFMFYLNKNFNCKYGNISNWNVKNIKDMEWMFEASPLDLGKPVMPDNFKEYVKEAITLKRENQKTEIIKKVINIIDKLDNIKEKSKEIKEEYNNLLQTIEQLENKLNSSNNVNNKQINQQNNYKQPKPKK